MVLDEIVKGRPLTLLQERFMRLGIGGLGNQEVVELLLSLHQPCDCCEVKPLPEHCQQCRQCFTRLVDLSRNIMLRDLLMAPPEELKEHGISPFACFIIKLIRELPELVLKEKMAEKPVYQSSRELFEYLQYSMQGLQKEIFKVVYLNNRNQIVDTADLFEGTLQKIHIHPREIVESAIKHKATNLIFAHNHPAGDPTPSRSDRRITRDMVFIGIIAELRVLDHIIIAENKYFSFADEELIKKYEDDFMNLELKIKRMSAVDVTSSREPHKVYTLHSD